MDQETAPEPLSKTQTYYQARRDSKKQYYLDNKERIRAGQTDWRRKATPEQKAKNADSNRRQAAKVTSRWKELLRAAASRGLPVDITFETFEQLTNTPCIYCGGFSMDRKTHSRTKDFTGVDRYDNTKGYVVGNCCPCCFLCNQMKSALPLGIWIDHMKKIVAFSG